MSKTVVFTLLVAVIGSFCLALDSENCAIKVKSDCSVGGTLVKNCKIPQDADPGLKVAAEYYQQRRDKGRMMPDTLDLVDNAILAMHAITHGQDPNLENRLWFIIYFDRRPLTMRHHQLSEFDQAGKYLEGMTLMRMMTGSDMNQKEEQNLWDFMNSHTKEDGLVYYNENDEKPIYTYTQARTLLARVCKYELTKDPEIKKRIEKTIDSLLERKMTRGFGFGPLLPAVRYYKLTGYPNALKLAELDYDILRNKGDQNDDFNKDGTWKGHFHYHSGAAIGILAYGLLKNDANAIELAKNAYEHGRAWGTDFGYFPENLPDAVWVGRVSNEGCCTADMTSLAAILSQNGIGDYWDDLDRYLRNQLTEMQLKRTDFLDRIPKENQVEIPISAERLENEVDDWTRFVGTFAGWAAMNDFCGPAHFWIQQCCLGNAPRGLYQGWESIVTADKDGFKINLLLNRSTPEIDVDSYLPYEGKVEVNVKADTKLKLRIPGWVDLRAVKASVDGKDVLSQYDGRYIKFGSVSKGSTIVVTFPVTEQKVTYNIACPAWCSKYSMTDIYSGSGMPQPKSVYDVPEDIVKKILTPEPYTALFRGNTIVDMKPEGTIYPLYRREYMRESSAPMRKVERNIPDKLVHNWY